MSARLEKFCVWRVFAHRKQAKEKLARNELQFSSNNNLMYTHIHVIVFLLNIFAALRE
jgi:hypothetical protein